jgi:diguanylate cyclase
MNHPTVLLQLLLRSLLILLLSFAVAPAFADSTQPLQIDKSGELVLNSAVQYLEDPDGRLAFGELGKPGLNWQENGPQTFNHGFNNSSWWLRFRVQNPGSHDADQLLEIGYAVLDYIDIYVTENGQLIETFSLGDKLPFYSRPIDHRYFVVPITWKPAQTLDIFIRLKSGSSIQAPLTLWDPRRFSSLDTTSSILQGIYYGGMVVIAVYNLLIFLVLRSRNYLYYVGFVLSMPMFLAAMSGQSFRFLWPNSTTWNDQATAFFLASTLVCGTIFTRRFLRVPTFSKPLAWFMNALAACSFVVGAMVFFAPYHLCIQLLVLLIVLCVSSDLFAGIYALRQRQTSARIYLVAWFVFLVGSGVLALNKLGILPNNILTEYSAQIGSLIEVVLLSFALAERINVERRLRFDAQTETLNMTRKLNEDLEERVMDRTKELEQLNQLLRDLSETDQLTELKNRRFMQGRLAQEWARCMRYRHPLAIILLDVDHFKQVNDSFGHLAGDACLQQVARCVSAGLRWPADMAARYGGEEFCLMLPETTEEGAAAVAERIRAAVEQAAMETDGQRFRVTISAGVFSAIPDQALAAETFVRNADAALYRSKMAGRNRVTVAGEDT